MIGSRQAPGSPAGADAGPTLPGGTAAAREAACWPDCDAFVELSDGLCHYRVDGPADGPVVLMIHGATVPAWEFDRLVPYLVDAGLRTVRADLYGHGYSDRPRAVYDHRLFVRQLTELLDALELGSPVHVLGHSLGAAIGARLAVAEPARVGSLVLAAPLVDFIGRARAARLLRWPVLGEALVPAYVVPMLVRRRTRRYRPIEDGRFVVKFRNQLRKPGFDRALLSLIRSGALADQSDVYRALDPGAHPVLMLRGAQDVVVTADQVARIRALAPHVEYRELPGVAHALMLSHPERVAPAIIDFLGR